jgi:hypothetical protein
VLSARAVLERYEDLLVKSGWSLSSDWRLTVHDDDEYGTMHLRLTYSAGYIFETTITIDVVGDYPHWVSYNLHLQDGLGRCVFRYDNAAHYPAMSTFLHHKHVGPDEQAVEHPRPSLHQIIAEVERAVSGQP